MAEWNTAIHASSRLVFQLAFRKTGIELLPVLDSLSGRSVNFVESLILHETASFIQFVESPLGSRFVNKGVLDVADGRLMAFVEVGNVGIRLLGE